MKAHHILPSARNSPSSGHGVRSRTSKACDRCRLKKIKCDGATRCLRCQGDNAICIYGDRKKAHDKVYPKGYAQLLQQQQRWLVNGIQKLYQCIQIGEGWPADPLKHETNNQPLTHDILTALGVLDPEQRVCSKGEHETPQQGLNEHMDECTQRSKTSPGPQGSIHIQPFPMPRDLNGFSPEDQLERGKVDPDLAFSAPPSLDTTGTDDHLQLFPNSSFYTYEEASLTTMGNNVDIINSEPRISPNNYFLEDSCISTDIGNDSNGLNLSLDTGTVETWPMLTEPFLGPFYSHHFPSESLV